MHSPQRNSCHLSESAALHAKVSQALTHHYTALLAPPLPACPPSCRYCKRHVMVQAEVDSRDDAYRWLMHWLSR